MSNLHKDPREYAEEVWELDKREELKKAPRNPPQGGSGCFGKIMRLAVLVLIIGFLAGLFQKYHEQQELEQFLQEQQELQSE